MPYRNLAYNGSRLLPVAKNDAQFTFRAYFNFSTSTERVITVSRDGTFGESANLLELRDAYDEKQPKYHQYINYRVVPKSGIRNFIARIDSLDLLNTHDQVSAGHAFDQPFSLYVIEIREGTKYNIFRFTTNYPYKDSEKSVYLEVQKLLLQEFDIPLYIGGQKSIAHDPNQN